jgi:hypothetical protein
VGRARNLAIWLGQFALAPMHRLPEREQETVLEVERMQLVRSEPTVRAISPLSRFLQLSC